MLAGDNCKHGTMKGKNSEVLYEIIDTVTEMVASYFPNTPIINSIGNNDVLNHNQPPTYFQKDEYYGKLWEIWFKKVKAN